MENKITQKKLEKYFAITEKALEKARKSIKTKQVRQDKASKFVNERTDLVNKNGEDKLVNNTKGGSEHLGEHLGRVISREKGEIINERSQKIGNNRACEEIIEMVENYLNDSKYFEQKKDFVNAFAAINYAHGWLDAGVRLDIFDIKDDKLFTIK